MGKKQHKTRPSKSTKKQRPSKPQPMKSYTPSTHYAILGIEYKADVDVIRARYLDLVRQFPPETHPEEFQKIRTAYEVLSNPETRRQYDLERFYGASLNTLLERSRDLLERNRVSEAIQVMEQITEISPTGTQFLELAQAYGSIQRTKAANQMFDKALDLASTDEERVNILISKAHANYVTDSDVIVALLDLNRQFPQIAPRKIAPDLFAHYANLDQIQQGMTYYRSLLRRKKVLSPEDYQVYLEWLYVMMEEFMWEDVQKVASRIKIALLKAVRGPHANSLQEMTLRELTAADDSSNWQGAAIFAELLLTLDPDNKQWATKRRHFINMTLLQNQLTKAVLDFELPTSIIIQAFTLFSKKYFSPNGELYPEALNSRPTHPTALAVPEAISRLQQVYPRLYREFEEQWEALKHPDSRSLLPHAIR